MFVSAPKERSENQAKELIWGLFMSAEQTDFIYDVKKWTTQNLNSALFSLQTVDWRVVTAHNTDKNGEQTFVIIEYRFKKDYSSEKSGVNLLVCCVSQSLYFISSQSRSTQCFNCIHGKFF